MVEPNVGYSHGGLHSPYRQAARRGLVVLRVMTSLPAVSRRPLLGNFGQEAEAGGRCPTRNSSTCPADLQRSQVQQQAILSPCLVHTPQTAGPNALTLATLAEGWSCAQLLFSYLACFQCCSKHLRQGGKSSSPLCLAGHMLIHPSLAVHWHYFCLPCHHPAAGATKCHVSIAVATLNGSIGEWEGVLT